MNYYNKIIIIILKKEVINGIDLTLSYILYFQIPPDDHLLDPTFLVHLLPIMLKFKKSKFKLYFHCIRFTFCNMKRKLKLLKSKAKNLNSK